jgi:hypothetical protein
VAAVEGKQREVIVERRRGDYEIEVLDQVSSPAKVNTQRCELHRNKVVGVQNRISMRELLDTREAGAWIVGPISPVVQFSNRYPTYRDPVTSQVPKLSQYVMISGNSVNCPVGVE